MTYNSHQKKILNSRVTQDIKCIERLFNDEVNRWVSGENTIRLLILAEAPLSCAKYIYGGTPGNFLTSLRQYFQVGQKNLLPRLRKEGVFVLDMYEFPIDTSIYDADGRTHHLFNDHYLLTKLDLLRKHSLLNEQTHMIFRFKKLVYRYFDMQKKGIKTFSLDSIHYRQWIHGTLNITERPQKISPVVKVYI